MAWQLFRIDKAPALRAPALTVSRTPVAFHKYSMMEKLGITTNAALLVYAMKHHVISA